MKRKALFTAIISAAVLAFAVPAAAETFTSSDGVLSIELPNENWKEMTDPQKWIVLSDGANTITIDHYSNGERLPEIKVADEHYVNVFEVSFSTQNEVFIITGSVVDAAKISEVQQAIISTQILKLDTKTKISAEQKTSPSDITVVAADKTMYVISDGLNVRSGCSTGDQIIGAYSYGATVKVTGIVQKDGKDFGWYQINYNGAAGFVSSAYLSDKAPSDKKTNSDDSFTGTATTIYNAAGQAITIYKSNNGNWYDGYGMMYTWVDSYTLKNENGDILTTTRPSSGSNSNSSSGQAQAVNSFTVYWQNGNADTLTQYSDGTFRSSGGVQYFDAGGGAYAGSDGTTLYINEPEIGTAGSSLQHGLSSQGSGRPVQISSDDGKYYYDASGQVYYPQDDGTWIDGNGDVFNEEW